jgi:hypothetical protein
MILPVFLFTLAGSLFTEEARRSAQFSLWLQKVFYDPSGERVGSDPIVFTAPFYADRLEELLGHPDILGIPWSHWQLSHDRKTLFLISFRNPVPNSDYDVVLEAVLHKNLGIFMEADQLVFALWSDPDIVQQSYGSL